MNLLNLDEKNHKKVWQPASKKMMDTIKPYLMQVYKEKRTAWIVGIGIIMILTMFIKWWDLRSLEEPISLGRLIYSIWVIELFIGSLATLWFLIMVKRPTMSLIRNDLQFRIGDVMKKEQANRWFRSKNYITMGFGHGDPWRKSAGMTLFSELSEGDQVIHVSLKKNDRVYELVPVSKVGSDCIDIDE